MTTTSTEQKSNGQNGTPRKAVFTPQQLHEALFLALDVMERAVCPFVLLKDTAKRVKESSNSIDFDLEGLERIDLGVKTNELTKERLEVFKTYAQDYRNDGTDISFIASGVPVVIRIIHRNYKVFNNPDTVFYKIEQFNIPNPWGDYWEMRGFIR